MARKDIFLAPVLEAALIVIHAVVRWLGHTPTASLEI